MLVDTTDEDIQEVEDDVKLIFLETTEGQPSPAYYLCEGLRKGIEMSEILSIYIEDPPPRLPELVGVNSKEDYCKRISYTVVTLCSYFHINLEGALVWVSKIICS